MITNEELIKIDKYFRAANYLSACQLYLLDNPLLKRPLKIEDIKRNIVGHWGTVPGQNFIYTHLNRIIKKYDLNMIYLSGPGHGGNAMVAQSYLEGTYSEVYPNISQDEEGLKKLFKQFSFPGGISSHVAPETPGSINEGGELGYSLAHAYGAVLDNPDLIAACVVGDGEAETGPLATSWHLNKFINPKTDGVVLPILHLNGYKIANPTIFARISNGELLNFFKGCGYEPFIVEDSDDIHERMANTLDIVIDRIKKIKSNALINDSRPIWPMIILKTKKGWTGPKEVKGSFIEGTFRAHQVPIPISRNNPENLNILEEWLKSYRPWELFDENGRLIPELKELAPVGDHRMSANPNANGGVLLRELRTPDFKDFGINVERGITVAQDMKELGRYVKELIRLNEESRNFRVFGPDEALSNRLNYMFDVTNRQFMGTKYDYDEFLNDDGRVIDSYLSEHVCEGLLEGYLLTGRHGFFHSYEAFVRIVDSMASQHAKWLKVTSELAWRRPIASLNYVLTSHIWQQDHNGYTHQDPGFLNHLATKKADTVRMYLPIDTNTLLSCFNHCIKSKNYINVIIASKHLRPQYLSYEEANLLCEKGIKELDFISCKTKDPDIVMACCGDTPTLEVICATKIMRKYLKNIKIRVVNVIDLMKLQTSKMHPHGLTNKEYDSIFTKDKPIIFAFHGYPNLIHELTYKRTNKNLHVKGYIEEGTITTPFDMRVQNKIDRYNLILDALKYLDETSDTKKLKLYCKNILKKHEKYIKEYGKDIEEVENFKI